MNANEAAYNAGYAQAVADTENSLKRHMHKFALKHLAELENVNLLYLGNALQEKQKELQQELCRVTKPIGLKDDTWLTELF